MNTEIAQTSTGQAVDVERICIDHSVLKRLGHWTRAGAFHVRARRSSVVLDLRSPSLPEDMAVDIALDHATLTLLVPTEADVRAHEISWSGRGQVHDSGGDGRQGTIHVAGRVEHGQVRVRRAGSAQLTAMLSREFLAELRACCREHRDPVIDDPRRVISSRRGRNAG